MRHKTPHVKRVQIAIILFAVVAFVLVAMISSWPATGAKAAPTVTPVIVQATATPIHLSLEWGQEVYILCYESAESSQPNGIINLDLYGSDNVKGACRPPGTFIGGE